MSVCLSVSLSRLFALCFSFPFSCPCIYSVWLNATLELSFVQMERGEPGSRSILLLCTPNSIEAFLPHAM